MTSWWYQPGIPTNLGARPGIPSYECWNGWQVRCDMNANNEWQLRCQEESNYYAMCQMLYDQVASIAIQTSKLVHEAYAMRKDLDDLRIEPSSLSSIIDGARMFPKPNVEDECSENLGENNTSVANKSVSSGEPISVSSSFYNDVYDKCPTRSIAEKRDIPTGNVIELDHHLHVKKAGCKNKRRVRFGNNCLIRFRKYSREQRRRFSSYHRYDRRKQTATLWFTNTMFFKIFGSIKEHKHGRKFGKKQDAVHTSAEDGDEDDGRMESSMESCAIRAGWRSGWPSVVI